MERQVPLKSLNTFGIDAEADYFAHVVDMDSLLRAAELARNKGLRPLLLGGGSNMLFTSRVVPFVIKNGFTGISLEGESAGRVRVSCGGGMPWQSLVDFCIERDLPGLENLTLIPGTVGAAPIQNIGAYGVELKDVFYSLEAVELDTGICRHFNHAECRFGYRDSIFKGPEYRDRFLITRVTVELDRRAIPNCTYGALREELARHPEEPVTCRRVAGLVAGIRRSKLPDPAKLGNAGSFFKNPVVAAGVHAGLKERHPDIAAYAEKDGRMKLAAGWLIEKAGWKGRRRGACGVHEKQALVIVNHGGASGAEVLELAREVQQDVLEQFGVELEPEVRVI